MFKFDEAVSMRETAEQMHGRLLGVIARSRFETLFEPYGWQAIPDPKRFPRAALAAVRDGDEWHALVPTIDSAEGKYRVFSFHFAEGRNASGFVAWLASLIKQNVG